MTTNKLQAILQSDKTISIERFREIIYTLKQDVFDESLKDTRQEQFYSGEANAFQICLDLLEKVEEKLLWLIKNRVKIYGTLDCGYMVFNGKKIKWDNDRPPEYPQICHSINEAIDMAHNLVNRGGNRQ